MDTEKVVLLLPITKTRPEEIRVIQRDEKFVVQSKRPGGKHWIYLTDAMKDETRAVEIANGWYPCNV